LGDFAADLEALVGATADPAGTEPLLEFDSDAGEEPNDDDGDAASAANTTTEGAEA
jgi:hypothetical protein